MTIEEGRKDMEINKSYVKGRLDERARILKLIKKHYRKKYSRKAIHNWIKGFVDEIEEKIERKTRT